MSKHQKIFEGLLKKYEQISTLKGILNLLSWDQETYLPPGAIDVRSHQIAELSSLIHKKKTSASFKNQLQKLIDLKSNKIKTKHLTKVQKKSLELFREDYLKLVKIPASFIHTVAKTTASATNAWASARKSNDYQIFLPYLDKIIDFNLKKADFLGYDDHPYDALIDQFEPNMTTKSLRSFFKQLKPKIIDILNKTQAKQNFDTSFLDRSFPKSRQRMLGNILLEHLKLDPNHSRMDESTHPFSIGIHPNDVRITTRIENNFLSNLYSILHECGHAFYERNLPVKYFGSPICDSTSLSIHESQSRFWEVFIGRSFSFWQFFYPFVQKSFPKIFKNVSLPLFYKAIHKVSPSFIRVNADELTYCLHIILRFELELEMLEKKIKAKDLPDAWNEKMESFLGIKPKNASQGCLQDIHWSFGEFGYFPTYALGNMIAAQIFNKFISEHRSWEKQVIGGDLVFIQNWLKAHIHEHGRLHSMDDLVQMITGKKLSPKPYMDYLENKYTEIYDL